MDVTLKKDPSATSLVIMAIHLRKGCAKFNSGDVVRKKKIDLER